MHLWFATAAQAETGERHRGAHQLEETAARYFVARPARPRRREILVPTSREIPACRSTRRGCASIVSRFGTGPDVAGRVSLVSLCGCAKRTEVGSRMRPEDRIRPKLQSGTTNFRSHRWHPWQFVGGFMFHRCFNVSPISAWVRCFFFDQSSVTPAGFPYFATNAAGSTSDGFQFRFVI